jgi:hypothetical protein
MGLLPQWTRHSCGFLSQWTILILKRAYI